MQNDERQWEDAPENKEGAPHRECGYSDIEDHPAHYWPKNGVRHWCSGGQ